MHEKVKRTKTTEQALVSLMELCARAERSTGDAKRLMYRWGVPKEEHEKVINKLIDEKFIDDSRYAAAYVREKTNLSGWGVHKMRSALVAKGIASNIIDKATSSLDKQMTQDKLDAMLVRKLKSVKDNGLYEIKGKLMRYGLGLGYEYDSVMQAVDKIIKDND